MTATETTTEIAVVSEGEPSEEGPDPAQSGGFMSRFRRPQTDSSQQPKKPPRPLTPGTVTALWILVVFGLLALWVVSYALVFSAVQQTASQRELYATFREELAKATAPVGGAIDPGSPVLLITAPGFGITNQVGVEGASSSVMRLGIGHRRDTPLPGQLGVSVLFGRSIAFGGPFADLSKALPGQTITVTTGQGVFDYKVMDVRRPGDPLPPPLADGESRLVLAGAESTGRLESLTADSSVFVDAKLVSKPVETPAGRPTSIDTDEAFGQGTSAALIPLVFWLEALVLAVLVLVWARVRWGTWQTWIVGLPVIVGLLWGATSSLFVLLPNVL